MVILTKKREKRKGTWWLKLCHWDQVSGAEAAEKADHVLLSPILSFVPPRSSAPRVFADSDGVLLSGCKTPRASISHLASNMYAILTEPFQMKWALNI